LAFSRHSLGLVELSRRWRAMADHPTGHRCFDHLPYALLLLPDSSLPVSVLYALYRLPADHLPLSFTRSPSGIGSGKGLGFRVDRAERVEGFSEREVKRGRVRVSEKSIPLFQAFFSFLM